jgi:hypothetical protein
MKKIVIIALVLGFAATARAYDVPIEVGAFGGGHIFSSTNHLGLVPDNPHALSNTGTFGFRVGFQLLRRLTLETELALSPTEAAVSGDSVLTIGWRGHALVHILTKRWRPFVLVGGGGVTASSSNATVVHEDTRGELHAGVGLKVDIRCNWGLRVDGRIQFEQATGNGTYFTEDYEVIAGVYGLFGHSIREKCVH